MSYSLNTPCNDCTKISICTDRAVLSGAVEGIHRMPFGVGHHGAGSIDLNCCNYKQKSHE